MQTTDLKPKHFCGRFNPIPATISSYLVLMWIYLHLYLYIYIYIYVYKCIYAYLYLCVTHNLLGNQWLFPFWNCVFQGRIFQKYHVSENMLYLKDISVIGVGFLLQWHVLWGFMVKRTLLKWHGLVPWKAHTWNTLTPTTPFEAVAESSISSHVGRDNFPSSLPVWARENFEHRQRDGECSRGRIFLFPSLHPAR